MLAKITFLLAALFLQEWVLLNTVLLAARNGLYAPSLFFILFSVASAIDIIVGFYIGKYLKKRTSQTKIGRYIEKLSNRFSRSVNSPKRWLVFLILGNFSFCYINAAVMGYLELPFWEASAYNFFGNILSIVLAWYAVVGINTFFKNIYLAAAIIIALSVGVILLLRRLKVERL